MNMFSILNYIRNNGKISSMIKKTSYERRSGILEKILKKIFCLVRMVAAFVQSKQAQFRGRNEITQRDDSEARRLGINRIFLSSRATSRQLYKSNTMDGCNALLHYADVSRAIKRPSPEQGDGTWNDFANINYGWNVDTEAGNIGLLKRERSCFFCQLMFAQTVTWSSDVEN